MKEVIIEALACPKKSGKFKEQGFVRGVLYGEGMEATTSVKFDLMAIKNLIAHHGTNAKVWVKYEGVKKFGLVKEVQIESLTKKILHIDIQIIAKDQKMQLQVPIHFIGEEALKKAELELRISKHEVTLNGDMNLMPEYIDVDVSELELGGQVTYADFKLNDSLVTDDLELVYAVVNHLKLAAIEETETEVETEAVEPAKAE